MEKIINIAAAYMLMTILAALSFVVALVLKLVDIVDWSWWVVTSPIWGLAILLLISFAFLIVVVLRVAAPVKPKHHGNK